MSNRITSLGLAALVLVAMAGRAGADGEWFSQNGFTILEAVGTPELGHVLVGQDREGGFHLLREGDSFEGQFQIERIGSEQVRVVDAAGTPRVSLILHRNVPADVLFLAVGAVHQRNVVMAGAVDDLQPFSPDMLVDPAYLAEIGREVGLDVRLVEDVLLIRKGTLPKDVPPHAPTGAEEPLTLSAIRQSVERVVQIANRTSPDPIEAEGTAEGPVSVVAPGLSPAALAHYLGLVTGVKLTVRPREEPVEAVATSASAPVGSAPAAPPPPVSPEERQLYERGKALYKAGKFVPAFKHFQHLARSFAGRAPYLNGMALCLWQLGRRGAAVKVWRAALKRHPEDRIARGYLLRVQALMKKKAAPATAGSSE